MLDHLTILGKSISVYGLTAAVGMIAAVFYMKMMVRREMFRDLDRHLELAFAWALAGIALGSKLLYLVMEHSNIVKDIGSMGLEMAAYKYFTGGFVFYGGLLGCMVALYLYCKHLKVSFIHLLQLALPAFPLAHAIGRCGCFLVGCCYGRETDTFFAVTYTHSHFAPNGVPLIPTQLIGAVCELLLFILLYRDSVRGQSGGAMLSKYLVAYGVGRFILEYFRGDDYRGFIGVLSVAQIISLICIICGTIAYIWCVYRKKIGPKY